MRLTPNDLLEKTFKVSFRGFDPGEVDEFLNLASAELIRLIEEKEELEERLAKLLEKSETTGDHPGPPSAEQEAGLEADARADRIIERARDFADRLIAEAKEEADDIRRHSREVDFAKESVMAELEEIADVIGEFIARSRKQGPTGFEEGVTLPEPQMAKPVELQGESANKTSSAQADLFEGYDSKEEPKPLTDEGEEPTLFDERSKDDEESVEEDAGADDYFFTAKDVLPGDALELIEEDLSIEPDPKIETTATDKADKFEAPDDVEDEKSEGEQSATTESGMTASKLDQPKEAAPVPEQLFPRRKMKEDALVTDSRPDLTNPNGVSAEASASFPRVALPPEEGDGESVASKETQAEREESSPFSEEMDAAIDALIIEDPEGTSEVMEKVVGPSGFLEEDTVDDDILGDDELSGDEDGLLSTMDQKPKFTLADAGRRVFKAEGDDEDDA